MKRNTLLITGSEGFIGRNLAEYFEKKLDLVILRPSLQDLDLTNSQDVDDFIKKYSPRSIIHCATVIQAKKEYEFGVLEKNLRMFFNLYRSKAKSTKLINLGSGSEYSRTHWKPHMPEEYFDSHVPEDSHSFSKYIMSTFVKQANEENIVHLRLFGVFGKYEDYRYKFISNTIAKNLLGMPILINKNAIYDYLFVDDFSQIVEKIINSDVQGVLYNVVPKNSTDLLTIARTINSVAKKAVKIEVLHSGLGREYTGASKKLLEKFSDIKFTSLQDSISCLYEYYSSKILSLDKKALEEDQFLNYAKKINS